MLAKSINPPETNSFVLKNYFAVEQFSTFLEEIPIIFIEISTT